MPQKGMKDKNIYVLVLFLYISIYCKTDYCFSLQLPRPCIEGRAVAQTCEFDNLYGIQEAIDGN